jgi:hypothetical protein
MELFKIYKMRILILVAIFFAVAETSPAQNLIEGLNVETYYVATDDDTLSVLPGMTSGLESGMITYRVFLDLAEGVQLTSIFGNENHELSISSTGLFYNSIAGQATGHSVVELGFSNFPETLLDSYLTFGASTSTHFGVSKANDPDGSLYPDGVGVAQILTNDDPSAGDPITVNDGLIAVEVGNTTVPPGFVANPAIDSLRAVFGSETARSSFSSDSVYFGDITMPSFALTTTGVPGVGDDNVILIGQFTTVGELEFTLNITVIDSEGEEFTIVGDQGNLQEGELVSPFLSFPAVCGCTDPNFFEYDPTASCDDNSCENLVVLGCGDPDACNFNPSPYLNPLEDLCCYGPDDCGELDIRFACPDFVKSLDIRNSNVSLFPNPAFDYFFIRSDERNIIGIEMYSLNGVRVLDERLPDTQEVYSIQTANLPSGLYMIKVIDTAGNSVNHKVLVAD